MCGGGGGGGGERRERGGSRVGGDRAGPKEKKLNKNHLEIIIRLHCI